MPPDVGVAGGQLVHAQRPGVAGADRRVVVQPDLRSGYRACPGPKCRHMFLDPRRAPALVHHQVPRVLRLVLQRVHRHVWVVRHPRSYQQGGATGEPTGFGLECHSGLWPNNPFPVPKPGSKAKILWRLVGDYRYLNEQTVLDEQPLPLIEKVIQDQGLNRIFNIIDLEQGFHGMPLAPESRPCTAFWLGRKRYQWKVMPMGIKTAGAFFQRMMDEILGDLGGIHCYIDDILVGSRGGSDKDMFTKHYNDVRRVLEQLRKFKIIAETSKVDFFTRSVQFSGHILEGRTRKPAPVNGSGKVGEAHQYPRLTMIPGTVQFPFPLFPLMDCLNGIPKDETRSSQIRVRWTPGSG